MATIQQLFGPSATISGDTITFKISELRSDTTNNKPPKFATLTSSDLTGRSAGDRLAAQLILFWSENQDTGVAPGMFIFPSGEGGITTSVVAAAENSTTKVLQTVFSGRWIVPMPYEASANINAGTIPMLIDRVTI